MFRAAKPAAARCKRPRFRNFHMLRLVCDTAALRLKISSAPLKPATLQQPRRLDSRSLLYRFPGFAGLAAELWSEASADELGKYEIRDDLS